MLTDDIRRIKSGADLNVGDIVYQNMDRNDGLVLTKGYDTRHKYFVIVGKNSKGDAIGQLTQEDKSRVLSLVASCVFIDAHVKKVYRIGLK